MLRVVSSPIALYEEAQQLNELFAAGMQCLHLRKPNASAADLQHLLAAIDPQYYPKIVLHQHHGLAAAFGIKRLHYSEAYRAMTHEEHWSALKEQDYELSCSIHDIASYHKLSDRFSAAFLGPVYDSISKLGYRGNIDSDFVCPDQTARPQLIAIGGIAAHNLVPTMAMGFSGLAVLGSLWQARNTPLQQFKRLQQIWQQIDQS